MLSLAITWDHQLSIGCSFHWCEKGRQMAWGTLILQFPVLLWSGAERDHKTFQLFSKSMNTGIPTRQEVCIPLVFPTAAFGLPFSLHLPGESSALTYSCRIVRRLFLTCLLCGLILGQEEALKKISLNKTLIFFFLILVYLSWIYSSVAKQQGFCSREEY